MITDNQSRRLAGARPFSPRTKRARARATMLALALGYSAACSGERSAQTPPQDTARAQQTSADVDTAGDPTPADSMSLAAVQSGAPRFAAGRYELVLDRDQPLFDDSLAVRDHVERLLDWSAVDSARDWRDSARLLDAYYRRQAGTPDDAVAPVSARKTTDSADVAGWFEKLRCVEWRSGGTLTLHADGEFVQEEEMRTYCHGKTPAFTRRTVRQSERTALETCKIWEAPEPGIVPHLTCRSGRWDYGNIGYRYVGDTLRLNSDCDGSDTWVLRAPDRQTGYAVARSSDVSRLDEC